MKLGVACLAVLLIILGVYLWLALQQMANDPIIATPPELGQATTTPDESYLHVDQSPRVVPCPVKNGCKG